MQDIHSIGGGRFYAGSGGGGGGDRRLRPHQHLHHQAQQPPVLKCPRCDSANTKFCYYNNYNLSQPRHFCKSCRRYWTKGGVLRNVPVGGGCRKTKSSKHKARSTAAPVEEERMKATTNSHSSSESSSTTAKTSEAASAPPSTPAPKLAEPLAAADPNECGLFSDIGSLTNLMAASSSVTNSGGGVLSALPFEFGSISTQFRLNHHNLISQSWNMNHKQKEVNNKGRENDEVQEISSGALMIDQMTQVDLLERSNGGGFESLGDWQRCGDQGLFDLTNNVDQQYWNQNQWNDQDNPNLYLP